MSTRKKLGRGSSGHYISRGLLPRIKEYVASSSDSRYVDVERMASDLQAQYSEYSRKKRTAFFHLVSEVYLSHRRELTSPSSSGRQSGVEEGEEERLLCQREREHLKRSRESVEHGGGGSAQPHCEEAGPGAAKEMSSSESDEEEDQRPNFNILNDSLVDIYRNGREGSSGADQQSCDGGGVEGGVSDEQSTAVCDKSSDQQTSNNHETMSHDVVEPHPPSSMLAPVTNTTTNEGSSSPVECADAANSPLSEDGGSKQVTKKVSFSSPEVTDQHDYVVAEESRMRRVKKRKSKRHDDIDEGTKVKRKRSEDESSASSHLRAGKSPEFAVQSSSVSFSDVGGSADCLHEINKLILHMRCSQLFEKLGVRPPQGFLLHGPPGCGKTLIAHAVAGELGLPFIKLAATEVVSGVSGESEGTLRDLFQLAKDHAPCVLFIDEVDAICRKRETAQREMERRIVTQLLTCLDDLNASTNGSRVLVIGATSRPDSLDPALRRAGRFDREICVGIPDLASRVSILKVLCRNLRLKEGFNFSLVADLSPGFVGADLMALVTEAALVTINRVLSAHNQVEGGGQLLGGDGGSGPSKQDGVEGAVKTVVDDPRVLSQQELDSTFISTEDFVVSWLI